MKSMVRGCAQSMVTGIAVAEGESAVEFNIEPEFGIFSADHVETDGRYVRNRYATTDPNANIMSLSTGYIKAASGGATVTNFYANGPGGAQTASRVQFATDATIFGVFSGAPPADTYRMTLPVKLAAGGPTKSLRYGNPTIGYSTIVVNDTTWTDVPMDFTASGSNYTAWNLLPAASNSPIDLLVDEIQWYPDDSFPIPAFATETFDWHLKKRAKGYTGGLTRTGLLLDNTDGAGATGVLCAPSFPAATTFTEWTVLVGFNYSGSLGAGQIVVSETDAGLGTTANSLQVGTLSGTGTQGQMTAQPLNFGTSRLDTNGQGYHQYLIRVKTGARSTFFNGIEINSAATAYSGFQARILNFGGQSASSGSKGLISHVCFWPSYLSDADVAQAFEKGVYYIENELGETMGAVPFFYLAEGDSITATATAPQGPSYAYIQAAGGYFAGQPSLYLRNLATSGHGLANLEADVAVIDAIIAQAIAVGVQPVVTVLIGANDTAEIGLGYAQYWTRLAAYYAGRRAAGAIVVACTLLPQDSGDAAWRTERALLNTHMRAQTGAYDGLADFAADPDMGPDGAPTAGTYYVDSTHPNTAGHAILGGIMKPVLAALLGY